jgi:hypothetical protein
MTTQERDEALGFLMIVSFAVTIYLGIDNDWAWYGTALACIAVFFAWGIILAITEKFNPKPVTNKNIPVIARLRERQQSLRQRSRAV